MKIRENVAISELTTMRIGGEAAIVAGLEEREDIVRVQELARGRSLPLWLMGGGANTLAHDEGFQGIIALNRIRGIEIVTESEGKLIIRAMGGEIWDDVVKRVTEKGFSGIEALSKIPGTMGAAPVQNIGAYGQEVATVIKSAEVYDLWKSEFKTLAKEEMRFGYRKSRFNHGEEAGRFMIVSVTMEFHEHEMRPPFYNSLQKYIEEQGVTDFSPRKIREMVSAIRQEKLPDPKERASAGSFFRNVMVDEAGMQEALGRGIPVWPGAGGGGKINAGWLIEQCGLKGKKLHGIRVSEKAALVLINEDGVGYAELAQAREEIRQAVREKFGYELEQEPVEIPTQADFVRK